VFGFAPLPVLIEFGRLLPDMSAVSVYDRHREPALGWAWPNDREPLEFICNTGAPGPQKVALKIRVTADIGDDRFIQALPEEPVSTWEILSSRLVPSELRHKSDLSRVRELVGKMFDAIKDQHGMNVEGTVFPAAPTTCAVEFGRAWQPKVHPSFDANGQLEVKISAIEGAFTRPIGENHTRPRYRR